MYSFNLQQYFYTISQSRVMYMHIMFEDKSNKKYIKTDKHYQPLMITG